MNKTIAAALVGSTVLVGGIGIAAAQDSPSSSPVTSRCDRIPRVEGRLHDLETRIDANAGTAGSTAWLRARADQADANGHPRVATALRNRADRRAGRVDTIDVRIDRLEQAAARCADPEPGG